LNSKVGAIAIGQFSSQSRQTGVSNLTKLEESQLFASKKLELFN